MRTFVAVADAGQFSVAADGLSVTQQAVSKRVAALEKRLAVRLFARTARGVQLTADGEAFLPHARELLHAEERAAASVRPGRRALRVDVVGRRLGPASLLRDFHQAHPGTELDVVTLFDAGATTGDGTAKLFLVMELIPGQDLKVRIRQGALHGVLIKISHLGLPLLSLESDGATGDEG